MKRITLAVFSLVSFGAMSAQVGSPLIASAPLVFSAPGMVSHTITVNPGLGAGAVNDGTLLATGSLVGTATKLQIQITSPNTTQGTALLGRAFGSNTPSNQLNYKIVPAVSYDLTTTANWVTLNSGNTTYQLQKNSGETVVADTYVVYITAYAYAP